MKIFIQNLFILLTCRLSKCLKLVETVQQYDVEDVHMEKPLRYIADYVWTNLYFKRTNTLLRMLEKNSKNEKFLLLVKVVLDYHAGTIDGVNDELCHRLMAKMGEA